MRPVLLELDGFAAFREPTTVDFTGADYFALVGATGAGKSTVIDALTFALYGSVPRWDNQRTVALALAPTAGRGAVRFVFDVGGRRYTVARELRRAAGSGTVSVRNARLERLVDPAGTGAVGEATEPIADGAAATTEAVQALLGLPFADFCTCVVLPQGEFAEFLHTEPRKRQEKLVRILGLGVYDVIAKAANGEAAQQRLRAEVLTEQLAGYADATEDAERAATALVTGLDGLAERVGAAVPALAAAAAVQRSALEQAERVRADRARLGALRVPDGVDQLHARQRAAGTAVSAATERTAAAEAAEAAARAELGRAPARARLEQLHREHAELAAGVAELPGLQERGEKALADYELAVQDALDARAGADRARVGRDAAVAALDAAGERVRRLVAERAGLRAVAVPAGLAGLDARGAAAAAALERADAALAQAEAADSRARAELAAAPPRPPLEQARRDHRELVEALRRRGAAAAELAATEGELVSAGADVQAAGHRLEQASAELAQRQRGNLAATLRPTLATGADCPVCAQTVAELPAPLPAGDLAQAERAVAEARAAREAAGSRAVAADAARARAAQALASLAETVERLRSGLVAAVQLVAAGFVDERMARSSNVVGRTGHSLDGDDELALRELGAAVDDVLGALDELVARVAAGDAAVRAARRDRAVAAGAASTVRAELTAAATELRVARDPLVPFGAPAVGGEDVLAGWTELIGWARVEAGAREDALPPARSAAEIAAADRDTAERQWQAADRIARDRRAAETAAARAEQAARDAAAVLQRRVDQLRSELAGAPSADQVSAQLARRDELEAAAAAAETQLRATRAELGTAERAAAELGREIAGAWQALREARDPLVGLGAPALPGEDLRAAWDTLTGWALARAVVADEQLAAADADAQRAERERAEIADRLAGDLAGHAVVVDGPVGERALPAVAAAVERARGRRQRLVERRAAATRMAAERDAAQNAQQVARMLGNLLRSDGFPRWLVASALDTLVIDASARLIELSGGQFELTHADGEFLVIDHADADARRPVKTLSGGETFQASLALALALSDQLSGLAASGAARLESIFLDEGFGTLDEANLEIVAGTLENLAARGDRVVGLITHVPALAERVPVRYLVTRDERSSRVVRENQ